MVTQEMEPNVASRWLSLAIALGTKSQSELPRDRKELL